MKKRILTLALALSLVLALAPMTTAANPLPDEEINGSFIDLKVSVTTPHGYLGKVSVGGLHDWDGNMIDYDYSVKVFVIADDERDLAREITVIPNDPVDEGWAHYYIFCWRGDGKVFSAVQQSGVFYSKEQGDGDFNNRIGTYSYAGFFSGSIELWNDSGYAFFEYNDFVIKESELTAFKRDGIWPNTIANYRIWNRETNELEFVDLSQYLDLTELKALLSGADTQPAEENSLTNFTTTRSYTPETFTDIDNAWYTDWVKNAFEYGIIQGIGNNRFDPNGNLTGAQALTIGARIHSVYKYGRVAGEAKIESFKRDGDRWYDRFVLYAKAEGLIGNEFDAKMDTPVTRAEMLFAWSKILEPKDMAAQNTVVRSV
jgi:hypothetical protein